VLLVGMIVFAVWWAICIFCKPRFPETRTLYIGTISYGSGAHEIDTFSAYALKRYNNAKYIFAPKLKPKTITIGGIGFTATKKKKNAVQYDSKIMWYTASVQSKGQRWSADQIREHFRNGGGSLQIKEIRATSVSSLNGLLQSSNKDTCYVIPTEMETRDGKPVIVAAKILYYV